MAAQIINTNFQKTYDATEELCKTETDGGANADTTLWDWMLSGNWQTMTPRDMAAEWDDLSK